MEKPKKPIDESQRLDALYRYEILDTDFEKDFDDIVKLASSVCGTPISLISLIDPDRQWFKAAYGLDVRETPRDIAFCAHAIHGKDILVVPDTLEDKRFHDNPLVAGAPNIRFYAGAPLITNDGYSLGTLCSIDRKPRALTSSQLEGLQILSRQVCVNLELRLQARKLRELNESKNKLFSIISHDLRSPLGAMRSIVEIMEETHEEMGSEERANWLKQLRNGSSTSLSIAENLLKWARFEQGTFHYDPEAIILSQFVSEMSPMFENAVRAKSIELQFSVDDGLRVFADPTMLHSIIQNLVSNAIKFTPERGTISIVTKGDGNNAHILVVDTGMGMTPNALENLFRVEATYSALGTNGEKGSGLGLSLCKGFAEKMSGQLRIESIFGQGTTARLTLPQK